MLALLLHSLLLWPVTSSPHEHKVRFKHTVMMASLSQSGLGSIDVESKNKSLRIPWIQRILQGKEWNDITQEYIRPMGGLEFLLKCNYDTKFKLDPRILQAIAGL